MSEDAKEKGTGKQALRKKKGKKLLCAHVSCLGDPWRSPSRVEELTSPMEQRYCESRAYPSSAPACPSATSFPLLGVPVL
ncbi:hypothetical protein Q8A67_020911 [Cirrhinus molitorella]|uniref:Uncharacterized protein n=1 Tax=Cirrhinus molitorella TaxID=172907 RepID=A0AA88TFU6_9TELE|nr:hypothetical protein Q8A67_020911 [Cirrhinus molitorella]